MIPSSQLNSTSSPAILSCIKQKQETAFYGASCNKSFTVTSYAGIIRIRFKVTWNCVLLQSQPRMPSAPLSLHIYIIDLFVVYVNKYFDIRYASTYINKKSPDYRSRDFNSLFECGFNYIYNRIVFWMINFCNIKANNHIFIIFACNKLCSSCFDFLLF